MNRDAGRVVLPQRKDQSMRLREIAEALRPDSVSHIDKRRMKQRIDTRLGQLNPLRILLTEDNAVNQKIARQMLKKIGYDADVAANGLEVIRALELHPYDVILMDVEMPEMDGLTATRKIRNLWPENGPKIIALTAFAMSGGQDICLEAGMDGYIAKPLKMNDLVMLLSNIVPKNEI